MRLSTASLVALLFLAVLPVSFLRAGDAEIVFQKRIWDQAPHNAFTDLVRWKGRWWCAFREGTGHVNNHGKLRLIVSDDGETWESAALKTAVFADLRDAKLSVTPADRLMLYGAGAMHPPIQPDIKHLTVSWDSADGKTWSEPVQISDPDFWLWRVSWAPSKVGIGFGYRTGADGARGIRLYQTKDGRKFETLADDVFTRGYPNETGMAFDPESGKAFCLLRRDGKGDNTAQLGVSNPPYTEWTWKDLGVRVGGPALIRLPDGRFVAAGRLYDGKVRTSLLWLDPEKATLQEFLTFPSGGDTSYPGLVWNADDGLLWVSYYASHEEKTAIYLAKVKLPASE